MKVIIKHISKQQNNVNKFTIIENSKSQQKLKFKDTFRWNEVKFRDI